jgi:hypothetical protein
LRATKPLAEGALHQPFIKISPATGQLASNATDQTSPFGRSRVTLHGLGAVRASMAEPVEQQPSPLGEPVVCAGRIIFRLEAGSWWLATPPRAV